jgi:hypothetical protein
MATKKTKKATKRLRKVKKLEATKPLDLLLNTSKVGVR